MVCGRGGWVEWSESPSHPAEGRARAQAISTETSGGVWLPMRNAHASMPPSRVVVQRRKQQEHKHGPPALHAPAARHHLRDPPPRQVWGTGTWPWLRLRRASLTVDRHRARASSMQPASQPAIHHLPPSTIHPRRPPSPSWYLRGTPTCQFLEPASPALFRHPRSGSDTPPPHHRHVHHQPSPALPPRRPHQALTSRAPARHLPRPIARLARWPDFPLPRPATLRYRGARVASRRCPG